MEEGKRSFKERDFGMKNGHIISGVPTKFTAGFVYINNAEVVHGPMVFEIAGLMRIDRNEIVWEAVAPANAEEYV
jgi:hypothetical protein